MFMMTWLVIISFIVFVVFMCPSLYFDFFFLLTTIYDTHSFCKKSGLPVAAGPDLRHLMFTQMKLQKKHLKLLHLSLLASCHRTPLRQCQLNCITSNHNDSSWFVLQTHSIRTHYKYVNVIEFSRLIPAIQWQEVQNPPDHYVLPSSSSPIHPPLISVSLLPHDNTSLP